MQLSSIISIISYISINRTIQNTSHSNQPRFREIRPEFHHHPAQLFLAGRESQSGFQRLAEHEDDLVAVHHPHPRRPRVRRVALREQVRVDGLPGLGVAGGERVHVADEMAIAERRVQSRQIRTGVVFVQRRPVLKLHGVHAERVDDRRKSRVVVEQGADAVLELFAIHRAAVQR